MDSQSPSEQGTTSVEDIERYEVVDGVRVERGPMGAFETVLGSWLCHLIDSFAANRKLGLAVNEVLFVLNAHFNQVQHQYRLLASTWLLAMFAGVGFALSKQNLSLPAELIVSVIGLAGAIGVTQLWNLDIRVYHQLLDSCFVQGLKLEREYPWLPQLRSSMLSTQSQGLSASATEAAQKRLSPSPQGVLARVVWFYIVGNTVALLIALVGIAVFLHQLQLSTAPMITLSLILVGAILIAIWDYEMYRHTRSPLLEEWSNQAPDCVKTHEDRRCSGIRSRAFRWQFSVCATAMTSTGSLPGANGLSMPSLAEGTPQWWYAQDVADALAVVGHAREAAVSAPVLEPLPEERALRLGVVARARWVLTEWRALLPERRGGVAPLLPAREDVRIDPAGRPSTICVAGARRLQGTSPACRGGRGAELAAQLGRLTSEGQRRSRRTPVAVLFRGIAAALLAKASTRGVG